MAITLDGTNGINSSGVIVAPDGSASAPAITNDGDTNTGIFFPAADTIAFAEGGAEAMRIDSSGNVGIGNSNPSGGVGASVTGMVVGGSQTGTQFKLFTSNTGTTASDGALFSLDGDSNAYLWNYENAALFFGTNNTERARITSGGNLLVGTTSAVLSGKMTVVASGLNGATFQTTSASGNSAIVGARNGNNGNVAEWWYSTSTQVGTISVTSSATAYNTSSDYRLKENIAPMTGALATVAQLKPCTYTWKADGSNGQGFIAHELAEVCPDAVTGEKDATEIRQVEVSPAVYEDVVIPAVLDEDGNEVEPERTEKRLVSEAVMEDREFPKYQGVDTSFLVATLTAAIQELSAKNDALEARIAALEGSQT
jgi:hypothetical protein